MKLIGIICLLALFSPVQPAGADVYRYTDRHGNVIYTDDLDKVPDGQRESAKVPDEENLVPPGTKEEKRSSNPDTRSDGVTADHDGEKAQLAVLKTKLREEFNALAEENARLKAEQKTAVTPAQRKAFNKQVVSFNTRFQAYKEKEAAYKSRLEKYNKRSTTETSNPENP